MEAGSLSPSLFHESQPLFFVFLITNCESLAGLGVSINGCTLTCRPRAMGPSGSSDPLRRRPRLRKRGIESRLPPKPTITVIPNTERLDKTHVVAILA